MGPGMRSALSCLASAAWCSRAHDDIRNLLRTRSVRHQ